MNKIKFLVMDVDGSLTDGKIYIGNSGEIMKAFNVKDGYGISTLLPEYGILPVVLTGRTSKILVSRCSELGIKFLFQGVGNKLEKLSYFLSYYLEDSYRYGLENVAYFGDDLNDYGLMEAVIDSGGLVGCPHDAVDKVKAISSFISQKNGGDGAARDFIDWLLVGSEN